MNTPLSDSGLNAGEQKKVKKLGIIAGRGSLPKIVAETAAKRGMDVVTIAFFSEVYEYMKPYSGTIYKISIGLANKVIKTLKDDSVSEIIMIGKFEKKMLFENLRFDFKALGILSKMLNKNDDSVMLAIVKEFEQNGITVLPQIDFLDNISPKKGVITKRKPTKSELLDVEYGFNRAKEISGMDIGQTVVVKELATLAVEAIEGTDEAIKRGCALGKSGSTVVKVSKPKQDLRFDLPTVGIATILSMIEGNASVLAIEAEKTIILDIDEIIKCADKAGISIVAV